MKSMDVFNVRDLWQRTGDLLRDAENGKLNIFFNSDLITDENILTIPCTVCKFIQYRIG